MKTTIYTLLFFFALQINAQESCDIWINKMDSLASKYKNEEAKKMMKYYLACKGETINANSPILKNLEKISYLTKFYNGRGFAETIDNKGVIVDLNFNIVKVLNYTTVRGTIVYGAMKVRGFSDGLLCVNLRKNAFNDKWGFINTDGEEVIPLIYDDVHGFYQGISKVQKGGKQGYIDTTGKVVIPIIYDYVWDIGETNRDNLIRACLDKGQKKCFYFDIKGNLIRTETR